MLKRRRPPTIAAALFGALAIAVAALAQPLTHLADPANAPVSRWDSESASLDAELRARLVAPDPSNAPANFVAAAFETTDRAAKVRYLVAARVASPQEKLYLAALGLACAVPVHPQPEGCASVDRLADWARRDDSNGLPTLLLADRARQRGEREAMVAYLEQAAATRTFDDYGDRAGVVLWDYVFAAPVAAAPEVKARWVTGRTYAAMAGSDWTFALRNTCIAAIARTDAWSAACARVGEAMGARAATLYARRLGDAALERNGSAEQKRAAAERLAATNALVARCSAARLAIEQDLDSTDPLVRKKAVDAGHRWIDALAQVGETGTCERLRDALPPG